MPPTTEELPWLYEVSGTALSDMIDGGKMIPIVCDQGLIPITSWKSEGEYLIFTCPPTCKHSPLKISLPLWPNDSFSIIRTFTIPSEPIYKLIEQEEGKTRFTVAAILGQQELIKYWTDKMRFQRVKYQKD